MLYNIDIVIGLIGTLIIGFWKDVRRVPKSILDYSKFVIDEDSVAMKVIKGSNYLTELLYDVEGKYDHERQSKKLGMSLYDYVRVYRRDYGKTAEETFRIEDGIYASCNLRFWARYQMTYVVKKSTIINYTRKYVVEEPRMDEIKLPFPGVMVVLDLDDPVDEGHSLSYLFCKRDDRFDVTAIVDGDVFYFPICKETMAGLFSKKVSEYGPDLYRRYTLNLAWHAVLFLAAYNRNRKIELVRRVKLNGKNGVKAIPSEYYFDDAMSEILAYTSPEAENISEPGSALNTDGLVPPDERKEEIVFQSGTHESPRRHLVSGHFRTYWTGEGRKIPVRKFIEPYERGGRHEGEKIVPRVKIYE